MVSSQTSALAAVSHGNISSRIFIQVLLLAIDRTSVRTTANRTTASTIPSNNRISIIVSLLRDFCQTVSCVREPLFLDQTTVFRNVTMFFCRSLSVLGQSVKMK
jgi:hypothetical protein